MTTCFLSIDKSEKVQLEQIPLLSYELFYEELVALLEDNCYQVVSYYGFKEGGFMRFVCVVSDLPAGMLYVNSYRVLMEPNILLASVSRFHPHVSCYEQAITMNANADYISISFADCPVNDSSSKHIIKPILAAPPELHPVIPISFAVYAEP